MARLGTAIRLGVLAPGTRLPPERDLAEQLGISRSTLRQALKTLTASGHLIALRGRSGGTFVAAEPPSFTPPTAPQAFANWRDFFDVRLAIEMGATQLATERATPEDIGRLEAHTGTMSASLESWEDFRRADGFFHLAIAEASRSARLLAAMIDIQGELNELLAGAPRPASILTGAIGQHEAIIAGIRARDPSAAVAQMREHVGGLTGLMDGLIDTAHRGPEGRFPQRTTRAE